MIPPTKHHITDYADDPWQRAHTIPDFDRGPGLIAWLAAMLVIVALVAVGALIGWFAHVNAMEQAAICIEGCP